LLASYSNQYWLDGKLKNYPDDWNEERKDNLSDNNAFVSWFNDNFEAGDGYECSKKEFDCMLKESACKDCNAKDEITRMKLNIRYDSQMRKSVNKKMTKGFWIGFRSIQQDNE
jgi:hypothetical protein